MAEQLSVQVRDTRGKRHALRMRRAGSIPAVLYGHGKGSVSLSVPAEQLTAAIRHGSKLVQLEGGVKDSALIREIQWDTFGLDILHVDFTRVLADERVEMTISVHLRGDAPGTKEGGGVEHPLHEIQLECPVVAIPDKLEMNINSLKLGESLTVGDLELPEGVKLLTPATTIVVQCVEPAAEAEEEKAEA